MLLLQCLTALLALVLVAPPALGGPVPAPGAGADGSAFLAPWSGGPMLPLCLVERTSLHEKRDASAHWVPVPPDDHSVRAGSPDVPRPSAGERRSLASHLIYTLTTTSRL